jgi:dihydropteroate synthase
MPAPSIHWKLRNKTLALDRGVIMGIVNITPDSFSDGGHFFKPEQAVAHGLSLLGEGAEILDLGGESTRPGAQPVSEEEEIRRVIPVLRALRKEKNVTLSIDTMKPGVARLAIEEGADIINDVGGLRNPAMARLAAENSAGWIVMHMQGEPGTMQQKPEYHSASAEIHQWMLDKENALVSLGVDRERLIFDPGIGFGKRLEHNLDLLRHLAHLAPGGRPLCLGVSRKSMLGTITGQNDSSHRLWPTVALTCWGRERGVLIFRVHDVRENSGALRMTEAIEAYERDKHFPHVV